MLISVYRINVTQSDRNIYFSSAREQVELVRLLLRLMKDLKLMSVARFCKLNEFVESISKQLVGWQKSSSDYSCNKPKGTKQQKLF